MSFSTTDVVEVVMPQLGVSVTEGTVVAWSVGIGDAISADETICEVSTDKIDSDIPSPAGGVVAEILVAVGSTVEVGAVLARIVTAESSVVGGSVLPHAGTTGTAQDASSGRRTEPATAAPAPAPSMPVVRSAGYSPVVSRIAAEHGIDLSTLRGTGRDGRVRKQDVLAAVAAAERPLHSESPYRPEPEPERMAAPDAEGGTLSRMRRTIGEHMKRSLDTAATCTTWMETDMTRVEAARRSAKASGLLGVTALPIVARCAIDALVEHPTLNATLEGERYTRYAETVHLGIAVSLGEDGLIVPVIRDAQTLSVEQLGQAIKQLARRARSGGLTPDEVRGGTFTITNPGQFGSLMATPVINQPQVAILDLEAIVKRPVVVSGQDGEDVIAIRSQTILGLSWDHRALDGAQAAQFLGAVRRRLEAWYG